MRKEGRKGKEGREREGGERGGNASKGGRQFSMTWVARTSSGCNIVAPQLVEARSLQIDGTEDFLGAASPVPVADRLVAKHVGGFASAERALWDGVLASTQSDGGRRCRGSNKKVRADRWTDSSLRASVSCFRTIRSVA